MNKSIKFDPEIHTKVSDDEKGGFVHKTAQDTFERAKSVARMVGKKTEAMDVLRSQAKEEDKEVMKQKEEEEIKTKEEQRKILERFKRGDYGYRHDGEVMSGLKKFNTDREFMLAAIELDPVAFDAVGENLWADKDFLLGAIIHRIGEQGLTSLIFKKALVPIASDKDFLLKIIHADIPNYRREPYSILEYADDSIRGDREMVKEALEIPRAGRGCALKLASPELKADQNLILDAMKKTNQADILEYVDPALKNNKEFMMKAVNIYSEALKYASEDLRKDYDVVRPAILDSSYAFQYADPSLQENKELAFEVFSKKSGYWEWGSLKSLPEKLINDREFMLNILSTWKNFDHTVDTSRGKEHAKYEKEFLDDRESYRLDHFYDAIKKSTLYTDRDFILNAIKKCPKFANSLLYEHQGHSQYIRARKEDDYKNWKNDPLFIEGLMKFNPGLAIEMASGELRKQIYEAKRENSLISRTTKKVKSFFGGK